MSAGDGPTRSGQLFNPKDQFGIIPYIEEKVRYDEATGLTGIEGQDNTEIQVVDRKSATKRVYDVAAVKAALLEISQKFVRYTSIDGLPRVLSGLTVTFTKSAGTGSTSFPITQQLAIAVGDSGSVSINPRANAQSSAAIVTDLIPTIVPTEASNVPVKVYRFFQAEDNIEEAAILTRLTALADAPVLAWPKFRPVPHTFVLKGEQVSLQANAATTARVSWSSTSASGERVWGGGVSEERGVTSRSVEIPPTIHGAITLSPTSDTQAVDVSASAQSTEIVTTVPGGNNAAQENLQSTSATVTGSITPTSLAATSGVTAIPTSGLYLYRLDIDANFGFETALVVAEVFDFAYFA